MDPTIEDLVQEMTAIMVAAVDPQRVILFGSYAKGEAGPASDLDFLIVQDHPFTPQASRRKQMARLWRLLAHFPVSQDILMVTPEEVDQWRDTINHVIARALREGKVVYERA
ncbi:MAG: nucleotidyltransferase domain-containing protein [Deltaproteobacteria bacterium]|nr:nucleotidyltransferase domain-containing protein [Deltaproteobacteria bacterium]